MNRHDPRTSPMGEAVLRYKHNDLEVLRNGAFVRCAVTGKSIPLDELRYWSVEKQEPYASIEIAREAADRDRRR